MTTIPVNTMLAPIRNNFFISVLWVTNHAGVAGTPAQRRCTAGDRRSLDTKADAARVLARRQDTLLRPVRNEQPAAARDNSCGDDWTDSRRDEHDDHQCRSGSPTKHPPWMLQALRPIRARTRLTSSFSSHGVLRRCRRRRGEKVLIHYALESPVHEALAKRAVAAAVNYRFVMCKL